MNILLVSYTYAPNIGGIETISRILAHEFISAGHNVTVVTCAPGEDIRQSFPIVRRPGLRTLRRLASETDIIFQNNISINLLLPTLGLCKPIVVTHQTWLTRTDGSLGWQDRAKRLLLKACHNVSISKAIAESLPVRSTLIPNPYEASQFLSYRDTEKTRDLVFMGRLVSDKGCDLLLRALDRLRTTGFKPTLTVIGTGPELSALENLARELGLDDQIAFLGALQRERGLVVARHRIMVIPSKWAEPFGIVALEGIAAGCAIVSSSGGGLPDAIGPCGLLYPNEDLDALCSALIRLLTDHNLLAELVQQGPKHLRRFHPATIASNYLTLFGSLMRES